MNLNQSLSCHPHSILLPHTHCFEHVYEHIRRPSSVSPSFDFPFYFQFFIFWFKWKRRLWKTEDVSGCDGKLYGIRSWRVFNFYFTPISIHHRYDVTDDDAELILLKCWSWRGPFDSVRLHMIWQILNMFLIMYLPFDLTLRFLQCK